MPCRLRGVDWVRGTDRSRSGAPAHPADLTARNVIAWASSHHQRACGLHGAEWDREDAEPSLACPADFAAWHGFEARIGVDPASPVHPADLTARSVIAWASSHHQRACGLHGAEWDREDAEPYLPSLLVPRSLVIFGCIGEALVEGNADRTQLILKSQYWAPQTVLWMLYA